MLAKLTSKNQLTLPKAIVEQVRAEYYSVRAEGQSIVLMPVQIGGLEAVQEKLAQLGLSGQDVQSAIEWSRSKNNTQATPTTKKSAKKLPKSSSARKR